MDYYEDPLPRPRKAHQSVHELNKRDSLKQYYNQHRQFSQKFAGIALERTSLTDREEFFGNMEQEEDDLSDDTELELLDEPRINDE